MDKILEMFASLHIEINELTKKLLVQDLKMEKMEHRHNLELLSASKKIEELTKEVATLKGSEERWRIDLEQHKAKIMEQKTKETAQLECLTKEVEEQKSWVEVTKRNIPPEGDSHSTEHSKRSTKHPLRGERPPKEGQQPYSTWDP